MAKRRFREGQVLALNKHGLNAKQRLFVGFYIADQNATQAAKKAKYSEKTAHVQGARLLTKAKVVAAVAKGQAELAKRNELSADFVIAGLRENLRLSMDTGADTYNPAVANRALELLGKTLGLFDDRLKLDVTVSHEEQLKRLE